MFSKKSALLDIVAMAVDGEYSCSKEETGEGRGEGGEEREERGDCSYCDISTALMELIGLFDGLEGEIVMSVTYRLMLFDLVLVYIEGVLGEERGEERGNKTQRKRLDTFSPLLQSMMDCLEKSPWFTSEYITSSSERQEQRREERGERINLCMCVQVVHRLHRICRPFFMTSLDTDTNARGDTL